MRQGNAALRIVHEGSEYPTFEPGDTFVGHVSRKLPLIRLSMATVLVTLCGRAKTKITTRDRGDYHGLFTLIDEDAHVQTLFQGPIHIGAGENGRKWRFAITIPTHCCPKTLSTGPKKSSFLPLDAAAVAAQRLPDSFHMVQGAFVEYFIKATISDVHNGSRYSESAIFPFALATAHNGPPIADFSLWRHRIPAAVSSFKLTSPIVSTLSQKRQQLFGSPKVPRWGGHMEVDWPRVVQMDNPNVIPIRLKFVPNARWTSSELRGPNNIPRKMEISLASLHMQVESQTNIRCGPPSSAQMESHKTKVRVQIWPPRGDMRPLDIPCTERRQPVDVGKKVGLRLVSANELAVGNTRKAFTLQPDVTTYNMKREHHVSFELVALVAGEEMKMEAGFELVVLPPSGGGGPPRAETLAQASTSAQASALAQARTSVWAGIDAVQVQDPPPPPFEARSDSWIHPPPEEDAPPSFAEVEREDRIRKGLQESES
jgi:hypothetical protein